MDDEFVCTAIHRHTYRASKYTLQASYSIVHDPKMIFPCFPHKTHTHTGRGKWMREHVKELEIDVEATEQASEIVVYKITTNTHQIYMQYMQHY